MNSQVKYKVLGIYDLNYSKSILIYFPIQKVQVGMQTGLSGDLLAIDIREALYHFGRITGMYLLKINAENKSKTIKIIKE